MKNRAFRQVVSLVESITKGSEAFLRDQKNQTESMILEYKTSFAYDMALALCPFSLSDREFLLNDALTLRILETIVAFANSNGGLLVIGVAEKKGQIVSKAQQEFCSRKHPEIKERARCFQKSATLPYTDIGDLRVYGIDCELEVRGNDFDAFQRMIMEKFSLGSGSHARKGITFKPSPYPCHDGKETRLTVIPSTSPDTLIKDIFRIEHPGDAAMQLCGIVVEPASDPVTLNIREDGSHTVKRVFPFRQPGRTYMEEDFQRIYDYIQKRFRSSLDDDFFERLSRMFDDKLQHVGVSTRKRETSVEWKAFLVEGSAVSLQSGVVSTTHNLNGCSPSWFSGETTVILGAGELKKRRVVKKIHGEWSINIAPDYLDEFQMGYLVIGCLRFFGGLHSAKYGAQVEIMLNDKYIDGFSLMVKPPEHTDYFHRIPRPHLPDIWPLSACQTLYGWPVHKTCLCHNDDQKVAVVIDKEASWDIDYVAIVCSREET